MEDVCLLYKDDKGTHIEAIGYTGSNLLEILHFVGVSGFLIDFEDDGTMFLGLLGYEIKVKKGDYILRGYDNKLEVCNPRIFNATFTIIT
jgi:hypothetical protein